MVIAELLMIDLRLYPAFQAFEHRLQEKVPENRSSDH